MITPSNYKKSNKRFPVVYLSHGYSGNYSDVVKKDPDIQKLADENQLIMVVPMADLVVSILISLWISPCDMKQM